MAHQKPLVKFDSCGQAKIVNLPEEIPLEKSVQKRKRNNNKKHPSVVNGKLNIKVNSYSGIQKIPTSALIPYIPLAKLKAATIKVLVASGSKKIKKKTEPK